MAKKIFIIYAHQDVAFKDTLVKTLPELEQQELLESWDDDAIEMSRPWLPELEKTLSASHTVILLISRHLIASKFINIETIPFLLQQRQQAGLRVVPLLLNACEWNALAFAKSHTLPKSLVPIENAANIKQVWDSIAKQIRDWCVESSAAATKSLETPSFLYTKRRVELRYLAHPNLPLIGRVQNKAEIDKAYSEKTVSVVAIIAPGGVGKSALIDKWLERIAPGYGGAQRVFGWSFYNQGSQYAQTSSTLFFEQALPFFGHQGALPFGDDAKAQRLVALMRDVPSILVLDGVEPLQHPSHLHNGEFSDVGLKTLLLEIRDKDLGEQRLVLISSRQEITELQGQACYKSIPLSNLNVGDSASLFKFLGVRGTPAQLTTMAKSFGGHALALVLLGSLLADAYAGEVSQYSQLPLLSVAEDQGGQAFRVLEFYNKQFWSAQAPERTFMTLLALFDRPMSIAEKNALISRAEIARPLATLTEAEWMIMLNHLAKNGFLLESNVEPITWDTHPLIRSYFAERLQEQDYMGWRQAHSVLFDYFQTVPNKVIPDTLLELEPLYRAVHHGCLAGEYQKALKEVYWKRILRGDEYYSTRKLGTFAADLVTIADFFPRGWSNPPVSDLSNVDKSWLLAQAAFYLTSLGRLQEALIPQWEAVHIREQQQDWKNAAYASINLVDLLIPLGQLVQAKELAQKTVVWAQRSDDKFCQMTSRTKLATVLHRLGQLEDSLFEFWNAETLQAQDQPHNPQLYSLAGAQYCALLLDNAKETSEQEAVLERAKYALTLSKQQLGVMSVAFDYLTLGRALIALGRTDEAQSALDSAIDSLRKSNSIVFMPEFLLTRAAFHHHQNQLEEMQRDIEEALALIQRCGMPCYEVDACLLQGHLLLDKRPHKSPSFLGNLFNSDTTLQDIETISQRATTLIKSMDYNLRIAELSLLVARVAHHGKRPKDALAFLEVAKQRVTETGQWGLLPFLEKVSKEITSA